MGQYANVQFLGVQLCHAGVWGLYNFFSVVSYSFTALWSVELWVSLCWKKRNKVYANKSVSLAISMVFTAGASTKLCFRLYFRKKK